jgi:hypothetical protein
MKPFQNTYLNILTPQVRLSYVKRYLNGETTKILGDELIKNGYVIRKITKFYKTQKCRNVNALINYY